MSWWAALRKFLAAFIPAAIKRWWVERGKQQALVDKGAADQRLADQEADDEITAEARGRAEEAAGQTDSEIQRRLNEWRRGGPIP